MCMNFYTLMQPTTGDCRRSITLTNKMIWIALFFCITSSIHLSYGSKNCFKNVTTKKLTKNEEIATKYSRAFSRGSGKDIFLTIYFLENYHFLCENT